MEMKELILEAMKKAGVPLNAGKIAELTGLDRKIVDKAMAAMKKDGSIVSPVRCKWDLLRNDKLSTGPVQGSCEKRPLFRKTGMKGAFFIRIRPCFMDNRS